MLCVNTIKAGKASDTDHVPIQHLSSDGYHSSLQGIYNINGYIYIYTLMHKALYSL